MSNDPISTLRIDIVSDVVCPWCIIGYKQLERALDITGRAAELHWHPFELNPHMAEEGENLRDHLAAKYGTTLEGSIESRARLTAMGAELGFSFNYADDMKVFNTFRVHQLLHWADTQGRQHELKLKLFEAFFTERRNVSDPDVLAEMAGSVGLDRKDASAVLADGRYAAPVREAEQAWVTRGIRAVPAVIFDRRLLASGAQGVENYVSILNQLDEGQAA